MTRKDSSLDPAVKSKRVIRKAAFSAEGKNRACISGKAFKIESRVVIHSHLLFPPHQRSPSFELFLQIHEIVRNLGDTLGTLSAVLSEKISLAP